MLFFKKLSIIAIIVCMGLFAQWVPSNAQEKYPAKGIELVIPWAPGGITDLTGRIFANELAKVLKVPIVPLNKPGASATIGATYVHNARKDGYTILVGSQGWLLGSVALEDISYDPVKDFIPIVKISTTPQSLFVKNDSPFKKVEDVIDRAKKNPKAISCGNAGTASDGHYNAEIFQKAAGIEIKHVPFKGGGEVLPAVLGGHVDYAFLTVGPVVPHVKAGSMRVLAITGNTRLKDLPDVATFKEKGFTQHFFSNWNGIFVPVGVPQYVIDALSQASEKAIRSKELVDNMDKIVSIVEYISNEEFRKMIENEKKIAETIAQQLGLKKGKK